MSERLHPEVARYLAGGRVLAVRPEYIDVGGSLAAGVMLAQGCFWQRVSDEQAERGERKNQWWHKTSDEWTHETRLTRREQEGARRRLRTLGILRESRRGEPVRLWYQVDWPALAAALAAAAERAGTATGPVEEPERDAPYSAWAAWAARGLPADPARWSAGHLTRYCARLANGLHGAATRSTHATREIAQDLIASAGGARSRQALDYLCEHWSTFRAEKAIDAEAPHLGIVRGYLDDLLNRAEGREPPVRRRQRA
ncbi:MAG: hypothetical protein KF878_09745 [Planctomycetes bacterium]|nr:hypothetical protein [Planctomycetota bacterium]